MVRSMQRTLMTGCLSLQQLTLLLVLTFSGRRKPIAPTCNICLIRKDNTTIWCEVTSSIRTRDVSESEPSPESEDEGQPSLSAAAKVSEIGDSNREASDTKQEAMIELLLCLRPIEDGAVQARPVSMKEKKKAPTCVTTSGTSEEQVSLRASPQRPFKKRRLDMAQRDNSGHEEKTQKLEKPSTDVKRETSERGLQANGL
jgi:hypothetical protein